MVHNTLDTYIFILYNIIYRSMDLQLPVQSVSSNLVHGEVYSI